MLFKSIQRVSFTWLLFLQNAHPLLVYARSERITENWFDKLLPAAHLSLTHHSSLHLPAKGKLLHEIIACSNFCVNHCKGTNSFIFFFTLFPEVCHQGLRIIKTAVIIKLWDVFQRLPDIRDEKDPAGRASPSPCQHTMAVCNLANLLSGYRNSKLFKKLQCINYNKKFTLFLGYSSEQGEQNQVVNSFLKTITVLFRIYFPR